MLFMIIGVVQPQWRQALLCIKVREGITKYSNLMSRGVDVHRRVTPKINNRAELENTLFKDGPYVRHCEIKPWEESDHGPVQGFGPGVTRRVQR